VRHAIEHSASPTWTPWSRRSTGSGALDYARARARVEADLAIERLRVLPDSACRDSLLQLAHFSVERTF
jgi:octaprenyl-diphosphate synthase